MLAASGLREGSAADGPTHIYVAGKDTSKPHAGVFRRENKSLWIEQDMQDSKNIVEWTLDHETKNEVFLHDAGRHMYLYLNTKTKDVEWQNEGDKDWNELYVITDFH
jgi:hypothetical protein